jgi:hypothetical protein
MFNARAAGLAALLFVMATPAFADPPQDIDALVKRAMQLSGVPGMAVATVEHGQVTLARGYGVRRLGSADPVDVDTIFEIGSVSKAFTAAALAVLVDRGQIGWDELGLGRLAAEAVGLATNARLDRAVRVDVLAESEALRAHVVELAGRGESRCG